MTNEKLDIAKKRQLAKHGPKDYPNLKDSMGDDIGALWDKKGVHELTDYEALKILENHPRTIKDVQEYAWRTYRPRYLHGRTKLKGGDTKNS